MATQEQEKDALDSAMEAKPLDGTRTYFGQIQVDAWHCVLQKGVGKQIYDPGQHSIDDRRTAISIALNPLPDSPIKNPVEREMIAESNEWTKIVKPSLMAIHLDLRALANRWAQAQLVPTGRTYKNAAGEERQATTFKFIAVYNSEAECDAAAKAFFATRKQTQVEAAPAQTPTIPAGANNPEKDTALKFIPALWNASGKDVTKFQAMLAANPMVSKYFDINSPEVLQVIAA